MSICAYPNCQNHTPPYTTRKYKYCPVHSAHLVKKIESAHIVRQVERRIYRNGRDKMKRWCKLPDCGKPAGEGYQDYCSQFHYLKSFEKYQKVKS